jgi:hypothetical protein
MRQSFACVLVCLSVTPLFAACGSSSAGNSPAAAGAGGSSTAGASPAGASSAGSPAGGSSGVAGSGGSAGSTPESNCDALGACCADLDQLGLTTTAACQAVAGARDDVSCINTLSNYGVFCAGPGSTAFYCYTASKGYCSILVLSTSDKSTADAVCMDGGGTPVASCPTANLVGCCAPSILEGGCDYTNENPPQTKADCSTGIWSTVPPS